MLLGRALTAALMTLGAMMLPACGPSRPANRAPITDPENLRASRPEGTESSPPRAGDERSRTPRSNDPRLNDARSTEARGGALASIDTENPPLGRKCRVHLRRDAMGLAGNAPLALNTQTLSGRSVEAEGVIERVTPEWFVLRTDASEVWLPRGMILAVELLEAR